MSLHQNEIINEYIADAEMQCYCEKCPCKNVTNYMHHHDWSSPEDFCCEKCAEVCYPE